jgi:hypothetical protein
MQGFCSNPECKRLIFDTEKLDELPDTKECQHCHTINIIRPNMIGTDAQVANPVKAKTKRAKK